MSAFKAVDDRIRALEAELDVWRTAYRLVPGESPMSLRKERDALKAENERLGEEPKLTRAERKRWMDEIVALKARVAELEAHCCVKTRGGEFWARQGGYSGDVIACIRGL